MMMMRMGYVLFVICVFVISTSIYTNGKTIEGEENQQQQQQQQQQQHVRRRRHHDDIDQQPLFKEEEQNHNNPQGLTLSEFESILHTESSIVFQQPTNRRRRRRKNRVLIEEEEEREKRKLVLQQNADLLFNRNVLNRSSSSSIDGDWVEGEYIVGVNDLSVRRFEEEEYDDDDNGFISWERATEQSWYDIQRMEEYHSRKQSEMKNEDVGTTTTTIEEWHQHQQQQGGEGRKWNGKKKRRLDTNNNNIFGGEYTNLTSIGWNGSNTGTFLPFVGPEEEEEEEEGSSSLLFPFVVCIPLEASGNTCRQLVEEYFGADKVMALYNKRNKTCFLTSSSTPSKLNSTLPSSWMIQPMMSEMKLQRNLMTFLRDKFIITNDGNEDESSIRLYVMLTPGSSGGREESRLIMQDLLERIAASSSSSSSSGGSDGSRREMMYLDEGYNPRSLSVNLLRTLQDEEEEKHNTSCNTTILQSLPKLIEITPSHNGDSVTLEIPQKPIFSSGSSCIFQILDELSNFPQISSMGYISEMSSSNIQAQWITQSYERGERPWFDVGLTGRGQVVAVSDSGLDVDNCYFWDESGDIVKSKTFVDPSRRKVVQYHPHADKTDITNGHGTHVSCTIAGHHSPNGRSESPGRADGIAKDAKIAFFDIGKGSSPNLLTPSDLYRLLDPGYKRAGAKIHTASWGSRTNEYDYNSREFDMYMQDHEDFLIVVAGGNDGSKAKSIGSPATAKNVIAVGSSQSAYPDITSQMKGPSYLSYFSARGPTADGRLKPDLLAPGHYILSAGSKPGIRGECDTTTPSGLYYTAGTSMSAPVVSGNAALVRQYFVEGWYPSGRRREEDRWREDGVSGALVKAVLVNGGQELEKAQNEYEIDNIAAYDNNQGFGRVSLMDSLRLEGKNDIRNMVVDRKVLRDGAVDEYEIRIDTVTTGGCGASHKDFSVTLVWTDAPNFPMCGDCLLNDLDLSIMQHSTGTVLLPNGLTEGQDDQNNVERIRMRNVAHGQVYTVRVRARDLDDPYQKYSLVMAGCFIQTSSEKLTPAPLPPSTEKAPPPPPPTPNPVTLAPTAAPIVSNNPITVPPPTTPPTQTITTTYNGKYAGYGNMFNIEARSDILLTGLSIHTKSTSNVQLEIWMRPDKIRYISDISSSDGGANGWYRILGPVSVLGQGYGNPTPVPDSYFLDGEGGDDDALVRIPQGESVALYVTLSTPDIVDTQGSLWYGMLPFVENDDLMIEEGLSNEYRFGNYYSYFVWNGSLNYISSKSITTNFQGTSYFYGLMFDIESKSTDNNQPLTITGLDIHTYSTDTITFEIWTYDNGSLETYNTSSGSQGWTRRISGSVRGRGEYKRTSIPPRYFTDLSKQGQPIVIGAGEKKAFYVSLLDGDTLRYSKGDYQYWNDDLVIYPGLARGRDFDVGEVYQPRVFNGAFRYNLDGHSL